MIEHTPTIARGIIAFAAIVTGASLWQSARAFLPAWRAARDDLARLESEGASNGKHD